MFVAADRPRGMGYHSLGATLFPLVEPKFFGKASPPFEAVMKPRYVKYPCQLQKHFTRTPNMQGE
jgi:hypothetical protein